MINNNKTPLIVNKKPRISLFGPKLALALTTAATISVVMYSHYSQVRDKKVMREGVERDKERIRMRKKIKQLSSTNSKQLQLNDDGEQNL